MRRCARGRRCAPSSCGSVKPCRASATRSCRSWPTACSRSWARAKMAAMVTSADPRPGYDDPSQHLADWSELFARMVDRMVQLKARAPRASVLTEHDRARLIRDNPELAALDKGVELHGKEISTRSRFARRLGVPLPLEILRERFALAPIDIDI